MPSCEMCGKETPAPRRAIIEGTLMQVCGNCVKFGVEQAGQHEVMGQRSRVVETMQRREVRARPKDIYDNMQEELVEDYAQVVRKARLAKGFATTEDLGKKILEKKGTLDKVEAGAMHPDDKLVKKLEGELGIKLMEKPEMPVGVGGKKDAGKAVTLGDMLKDAMRESKK